MASSDGFIQQRGDILLLVAMGCTKDHHTVLQKGEAHTANSLIWEAAGSSWLSVFHSHPLLWQNTPSKTL